MTGFGMIHQQAEGKALHPDDMYDWTFEDKDHPKRMSDDYYERQLRAYYAWSGEGLDGCIREHIAAKIKQEIRIKKGYL